MINKEELQKLAYNASQILNDKDSDRFTKFEEYVNNIPLEKLAGVYDLMPQQSAHKQTFAQYLNPDQSKHLYNTLLKERGSKHMELLDSFTPAQLDDVTGISKPDSIDQQQTTSNSNILNRLFSRIKGIFNGNKTEATYVTLDKKPQTNTLYDLPDKIKNDTVFDHNINPIYQNVPGTTTNEPKKLADHLYATLVKTEGGKQLPKKPQREDWRLHPDNAQTEVLYSRVNKRPPGINNSIKTGIGR